MAVLIVRVAAVVLSYPHLQDGDKEPTMQGCPEKMIKGLSPVPHLWAWGFISHSPLDNVTFKINLFPDLCVLLSEEFSSMRVFLRPGA